MIKVGIIGSGFGMYGLLPAFASLSNCQVIALCAQKKQRVLEACKQYKVPKLYSDWQEMLKTEALDAIAVAVIPEVQYEICKNAIKKGLNIFAEKPLAATLQQAQELLNLAEDKKITHSIDFIFAQIPAWIKLKEMLLAQEFGKIGEVQLNWDFLSYDIKNKKKSWKTDVSRGGGALAFYFSHALYYLEWLFGPMTILESHFGYSPESLNHAEVAVDLKVAFDNGIFGETHISCNNKSLQEHKLLIFGEKKNAILINSSNVFDDFVLKVSASSGELEKIYQEKLLKKRYEDDRVVLVSRLAQKFINSCSQNKQMSPSFREGARVQELISEIRENNASKK